MEIDIALSEIESNYDFTFKEKNSSLPSNPLTYVYKLFLSSSLI